MEFPVDRVELMLLVASIVAMVTRRFKIPYTVGLVVVGIGLTLFPAIPTIDLTKELIFSVLLPPLIFEAALFLPWHALRKVMPLTILVATLGLVLSAAATAAGMHYLLGWPMAAAAVFGVLIAATDPVSVIATFKEAGVREDLRVLVEAESLFNDGTAAVLFGLAITLLSGGSATPGGIALMLVQTIGGGIAAGAIIGAATVYMITKTEDHLVELTFTTVAAYGSFLIAEHLHCSGVLATLTAGLIIGNRGWGPALSERGRESAHAFWEFAAFAANSLIFLLIGIHEARQDYLPLLAPAGLAVIFVLVGRAFAVYPISMLLSKTSQRISRHYQHVMVWGGLRGALALALALGLPESMPYRKQIITVSFAVVAFSVLIQGLTVAPLLRRFGLLPAKHTPH